MATATTALLLRDFLSRDESTFYIPAFQRNYSWQEKQCEELWNDIIKIAKDRKQDNQRTHFMSDIVLKPGGTWSKLLLIDGQQRITTILLLILAMRDIFDKPELYDNYIKNKHDKKLRIKLKSVADDDNNLMEIVEKNIHNDDSQIVKNYVFFKEKIEEEIEKEKISHEDFYKHLLEGLRGLEVIVVTLSDYDDANLIFEKINSAGIPLTTSDLIRNYLLMQNRNFENQNMLYENYWREIENNFLKASQMDHFFADYLMVKTNKEQKKDKPRLYKEFRKYVEDHNLDVEDILKDIKIYSGYFKEITNPEEVTNKEISMALRFFKNINYTIFHPLLLQIWHLWKKKKLTDDDLIKIIWTIEAFIFTLVIFNGSTQGTNKRTAGIMGVIEDEADIGDYNLWSVILYYMRNELEKFKYIPISDTNFKETFSNNIKTRKYDNFKKINQLMRRLEYSLQNEKERTIYVFNEEFQLEHILPRIIKGGSQWEKDFEENGKEEHQNNLWKLGNLTLTGYNPDLSNRDFLGEKGKKSIYDKSNMALNQSVKKYDIWTKKEIDERTDYLANQIVTMLMAALPPSHYKPSKQTNDDLENQYNLTKIKDKLDNDRKYFNGKKPAVIKIMEEEYGVNSWKDMLVRFLKILYEKKPDDFKKFVKEYKKDRDNMFFYEDEEKVIAGSSTKDKIDARKIADSNIWIKTVLATNQILPMIIEASDVLKLKEDDIIITLREEEEDDDESL